MDDATLDHFFEDLYVDTTAELFSERLSALEAEVLVGLLEPAPHARLLDLGCGHGRHLAALAARGYPGAVGVDRSAASLRRVASSGGVVRGDYRQLPFGEGLFDGAYAWYSGLFLRDRETDLAVLREVRRVLRPGARFVHDGANPARLAKRPVATHSGRTRDGSRVEEVCRFDAETGVEHGWRRMTRPDGHTVSGRWQVRHYPPSALMDLLTAAGYEVLAQRDERGRPFDPNDSLDLVVSARVSDCPRSTTT